MQNTSICAAWSCLATLTVSNTKNNYTRQVPIPRKLAALVVLATLSLPSLAFERFWDTSHVFGSSCNGDFNIHECWGPFYPPPGTGDIATWNTGSNVSVNFVGNVTNQQARIRNDDVTWNLNGFTYTQTLANFVDPSLVIGVDAGEAGRLTISNGTVDSVRTTVARNDSSSGYLTLDNNATLNTEYLTIGAGDNTDAFLRVLGGSNLTSSSFNALGNLGGTATAIVDGAGSTWTNTDSLTVGYRGTGTLTIASGGSTSHVGGILGNWGGSTSTINVSGSDSNGVASSLTTSSLAVGGGGSGFLNITKGGTVSNTDTILAVGSIATGTATIDGINSTTGVASTWTMSGDLNVGHLGFGIMNITNGGAVLNTNAVLALFDTSTAMVSVSGTDINGVASSWTNSGRLDVGEEGTGVLTITNGGVVFNTIGALGMVNGSTGTATVEGEGSTWTNSDSLYVGGSTTFGDFIPLPIPGGTGVLNVQNGGVVDVANTLEIRDSGTVNLTGGTLSTGSLTNNGDFAFNSGTFNLTNDNLVFGSGGLFGVSAQFNVGQTLNVTNTTTVNAGSKLALNNASFSSGTTNNNGQIKLDGSVATLGGDTLNNAGLLIGSGQIDASLNNTVGEIRASNSNVLTFTGTENINNNRIDLLGGSVSFREGLMNTSAGLISGHGTLATGSKPSSGLDNQGELAFSDNTDVVGYVNNNGEGKIVVSGGATAAFHDDVLHNGSEIRVNAGSKAVFFGEVSGAGAYTGTGTVFFEGTVLPGNSPGLVSVEGDLSFGTNSNTIIELGGVSRRNQYDAFEVGGNLFIGGELEIALHDLGRGLFTPQKGDTFDILSAKNIIGDFDLLTLALLGDGLGWQLDYLVDELSSLDIARLSVVSASTIPVPGAVWLFGSSLVGLMGFARKRKIY